MSAYGYAQPQQGFGPPHPNSYAPPPQNGFGPPHPNSYSPPPLSGFGPPHPSTYAQPQGFGPPHPSTYASPSQQSGFGPPHPNTYSQQPRQPQPPTHAQPTYNAAYQPYSPPSGPAAHGTHNTVPLLQTTQNHPLPFVANAMQRDAKVPQKSLVFCLTLDNPFHVATGDRRVVLENALDGSWETLLDGSRRKLQFPFLGDDEFLMPPPRANEPSGGSNGGPPSPFSAIAPHFTNFQNSVSSLSQSFANTNRGNGTAPNKFQKVIEIILRLYHRGVTLYPNNMIAPVMDCVTAQQTNPNYFHQYTLVEESLMVSPDQDEMYIRIHVSRDAMMAFAEEQGILLPTNPYSFAGGAPMSYSHKMDLELRHSVQLFIDAFPDDCKPDVDDTTDGFVVDVPDKMRLVVRMMRESWQFGGCGLQLEEMKRNGVLIRHFFPLHNVEYQKAYHLDEWAQLSAMFSLDPLKQDENSIRKYFGEEVALYFGWLVTYTRFLRYIAAAGVAFGITSAVAKVSTVVNDEVAPISNAIFSLFCVLWGITWNFRSIRFENLFATRFGQEAQITQELVRDEFQKESEKLVTVDELFRLRFDVPLTLKVRSDGSLVDLQYSHRKRLLWRYLVAYPVVVALTAAMVTLQLLITDWRLSDCSTVTSTLSSMCSVAVSVGFGVVFDRLVPVLNHLENNRTETEENFQTISKSFFFYFFSNFFALFAIALYPRTDSFICFENEQYSHVNGTWVPPLPSNAKANNTSSDGPDRLDEIMYQMLFATVVKPMIQNAVELLMPYAKAKLRVHQDMKRAQQASNIANMVNASAQQEVMRVAHPMQQEANKLWEESQLEPYESTSGDYLEITLQFGFMTMFAASFPLATVAALLYNILEVRLDAVKLMRFCQRPVARPAAGIGAWRGIQFFIAAMSVVSNGYMVAVLSTFSDKTKIGEDSGAKYKLFVVAQYVVMMLFYVVYTTYAGPSPKSERFRVKHALVSNQASRDKLLSDLAVIQRAKSGANLMLRDEEDANTATALVASLLDGAPGAAPDMPVEMKERRRANVPESQTDEDILL